MKHRSMFVVSISLILLAGCLSEDFNSSHNTRADAADDIARGWIPSALPSSTTNIHEWHNLDTNHGHGSFAFSAKDEPSFKAALTPMPANQALRSKVPRAEMESQGHFFYIYEDFEISVDWKHHKGQFWLGPN